MSQIFLVVILIFSSSLFAQKNHLILMGGGGEPDGETTIFDQSLKDVAVFLDNNKNWNPSIAFNGGHSETEKIINKMAPAHKMITKKPFTYEEFEKMLSSYENKIKTGLIAPGDKILLYIQTHGRKQEENEKTHSIMTSDSSETLVSLDRLQDFINVAESKGIKLGIIDGSCHSGSSLNLKSNKTCIISATSGNTLGYSSWTENFSKNLVPGQNLENIFLKTYKDRRGPSFPMISTPAGREIQEEFDRIVKKYITTYVKDQNADQFKNEITTGLTPLSCSMSNVLDEGFFRDIKKIEEKMNASSPVPLSFNGLISAIKNYQSFQEDMKNKLIKYGMPDLIKNKNKFCEEIVVYESGKVHGSEEVCSTWSDLEILKLEIEKEIARYKSLIKDANKDDASLHNATIKIFLAAKERKDLLLKKNPLYAKATNFFQSIPDLETNTYDLAKEITVQTQLIYNDLYKEKSRNKPASNPCKDFVL